MSVPALSSGSSWTPGAGVSSGAPVRGGLPGGAGGRSGSPSGIGASSVHGRPADRPDRLAIVASLDRHGEADRVFEDDDGLVLRVVVGRRP